MFSKMKCLALAAAGAMTLAAGAAQATSIAQAETYTTTFTILGDGDTLAGDGLLSFFGAAPLGGPYTQTIDVGYAAPVPFVLPGAGSANVIDLALADVVNAGGTDDGFGLEEVQIGVGVIKMLFSALGIVAVPAPSDFVLVSLYNDDFGAGFLDLASNIYPATIVVIEGKELSAVPLPAGGILLIGAMGGMAVLRRRKQAA